MRKILNDPAVVKYTPIVTTVLLEGANCSQMLRMIREHTAEGQSLSAWIMVSAALFLWFNFYRICTPDQKWAIRMQLAGIGINMCVIATVIYFRYFYHA
jgi:uncharacterized protein with PQ loop repeat